MDYDWVNYDYYIGFGLCIDKTKKKIIIHVIIISVSSITVAFTQQMAIVYGTTTGGNPTFLMSFTKIKWNCFMA